MDIDEVDAFEDELAETKAELVEAKCQVAYWRLMTFALAIVVIFALVKYVAVPAWEANNIPEPVRIEYWDWTDMMRF